MNNHGKAILNQYRNLTNLMVTNVYKEVDWVQEKFVANNFWEIKENRINFLDNLYIKLNFKSKEDWYLVDSKVCIHGRYS